MYHQVFDSQYNGYSTDELFFVSSLSELESFPRCSHLITVQPRIRWTAMEGYRSGTNREVRGGSTSRWILNVLTRRSCRFSPSNFVHKWCTPELIIHGSKDYRLPETDGIAVFHALQQYVSVPCHILWRGTANDVTITM